MGWIRRLVAWRYNKPCPLVAMGFHSSLKNWGGAVTWMWAMNTGQPEWLSVYVVKWPWLMRIRRRWDVEFTYPTKPGSQPRVFKLHTKAQVLALLLAWRLTGEVPERGE